MVSDPPKPLPREAAKLVGSSYLGWVFYLPFSLSPEVHTQIEDRDFFFLSSDHFLEALLTPFPAHP